MSGTLARENAMRNPKRTSATAAALMIGVALVGFITILASSTKASIGSSIDKTLEADLVVSGGGFGPGGLSPDVARQLGELPETDAVTGLRMAPAVVDGSNTTLVAADPPAAEQVFDLDVASGSIADLGDGGIAVAEDKAEAEGWALGDTVPVRFAETGEQALRIVAIYAEPGLVGDALISMATADANLADQFDVEVFLTVTDGVDLEAARAAVTSVTDAYPQAEVQDRGEFQDAQAAQVDMLLNLIYALLGLAVFIALLGIANTLALSIFERTRELGLLRAVGMTRRQLRATVRWEAVIIALLGTTLGLAIGAAFGWSIVKALEGEGLDTFTVPFGQLGVMTVVAAFAGVGAAILPARRAARLDVLEAIVSE
jgi:putative ABC transport system permease protein